MQTHSNRTLRDIHECGYLRRFKLLPDSEGKHFSIGFTQLGQSATDIGANGGVGRY